MIKIAVVEDEQESRDTLQRYMAQFSIEEKLEYSVDYYNDATSFLEKFNNEYNVILLDIEMPNMDGMTCAHKIREKDENVIIVFVTNMAQYAVKGYEVSATDFIVKPVSYFDFSLKVRRIINMLKKKYDSITINTNSIEKNIAITDLYYVEFYDRNLVYHTSEGNFVVHGMMKDIEGELIKHGFFRCSKYCIINLRYVQAIKGYFVTLSKGKGGETEELSIAQLRKKDLVKELKSFVRENM